VPQNHNGLRTPVEKVGLFSSPRWPLTAAIVFGLSTALALAYALLR
jgi:hypothetical protein